jgi:hypothetical protein
MSDEQADRTVIPHQEIDDDGRVVLIDADGSVIELSTDSPDYGQGPRGSTFREPGPAPDPLDVAREERYEIARQLSDFRELGRLELETESLRRQHEFVIRLRAAIDRVRDGRLDAPTQEEVAADMGIKRTELSYQLKSYPGLWKALTRSR